MGFLDVASPATGSYPEQKKSTRVDTSLVYNSQYHFHPPTKSDRQFTIPFCDVDVEQTIFFLRTSAGCRWTSSHGGGEIGDRPPTPLLPKTCLLWTGANSTP